MKPEMKVVPFPGAAKQRDPEELAFLPAALEIVETPPSPIGRAIVGRTEGDEIKVVTPNGPRRFEITKLVTIHDEA